MTFVVMSSGPIEDGDLWFHLEYGEYFLDHHTLIPDHSLYSWTPADKSAIYCAWISETILYLLNKLGGLSALYTLRYLFAFVYIAFVMYQSRKYKILGSYLPWIIGGFGIAMSQAGIMIKPEIFSFVFMTITAWVWWNSKTSQDKGMSFYLLPAVFFLWINSHGGVIFGVAYIFLLFIGDMLNRWFSPPEALPAEKRKHFNISLFLCGVSLFLTPYGWKYPVHLIDSLILSDKFRGDVSTVFAYKTIFSPGTAHFHFTEYLIGASLILIFLLWPKVRKKRLDWSMITTNLAFGLLYCLFLRTTYFWVPVFTFSALYLFVSEKAWWSTFSAKRHAYLRALVSFFAVLVLLAADYETICLNGIKFGGPNYCDPVEEAAFIKKNYSGMILGNDYNSGSYLIWSLWPETKVLIDARYFPYQSWYSDYEEFVSGKGIRSFLQKYRCDVWCLTYDFPQLNYFISSPDWKLAYIGPSACIFVPAVTGKTEAVVSDAVFRVELFQAIKIVYAALSYGDLDLAKRIVKTMQSDFPCSAQKRVICDAHNELGIALAKAHRLNEAARHFLYTISIDKDYEQGYANLGNVHLIQGRVHEAAKFFSQAIRLNPKDESAIKGLAKARGKMSADPIKIKGHNGVPPQDKS